MRYHVVDDYWAAVREAFVADDDQLAGMDGYSGWFVVASFDSAEEAEDFCGAYNEYADDNNTYVVDDYWAAAREAFVASAKEVAHACANYGGYEVVESFDSAEEAEDFCREYNEYTGEPDVTFSCCSHGCTMCAYDAAHSTGRCVYEGE